MNETKETQLKSPFRAALYCLLLGAGAGQIYNGQTRKGVAMMILFFAPVLYLTYLIFVIYSKYWQRAMAGDLTVVAEFVAEVRNSGEIATNSSFAGVLWIISMVDGWVSAAMLNRHSAAAANGEATPEKESLDR